LDRQQEVLAALQPLYSGDGVGAKRLIVHAICESRKFRWRTGGAHGAKHTGMKAKQQKDMALAKGTSPEDLIYEAVHLTLAGKRPWNREKYPNLANHLKWVITSLVQNLASSADNQKVGPIPEDRDGAERDDLLPAEVATDCPDSEPAALDGAVSGNEEEAPPEATILREVIGPNAAYLADEIYKAVGDDDQLAEVLLHLAEGKKPRHIKDVMNLSSKDVYRLTQKLRRRLEPILGVTA